MSGKRVLKPYTFQVSSLGASFQSEPTSIEYMDRALLAIQCTGTGIGTLSVQGSCDYNPDAASAAVWFDLPLGLNDLSGSGDEYYVDIQQTAIRVLRLKYVKTSGTGTIVAKISAKES